MAKGKNVEAVIVGYDDMGEPIYEGTPEAEAWREANPQPIQNQTAAPEFVEETAAPEFVGGTPAANAAITADINAGWIDPDIWVKDDYNGVKEVVIWKSGKVVDHFNASENTESGEVTIKGIHPLYGLKAHRLTREELKSQGFTALPGELQFNLITREFR